MKIHQPPFLLAGTRSLALALGVTLVAACGQSATPLATSRVGASAGTAAGTGTATGTGTNNGTGTGGGTGTGTGTGSGTGTSSNTVACTDTAGRWVTAWQGVPTDAVTPGDASLNRFVTGPNQTFRAIITPLGTGSVARLHLSNRFGMTAVTFSKVRIARRITGAAIDSSTSVPVTFGCKEGVTLAAGQDLVSDPVAFAVAPFNDVAISIAATDPGELPTHHHLARQTSFATDMEAGDHADDAGAAAFTTSTTLRPFVVGLDVKSTTGSAVVTFGDSITDGYQSSVAAGVPQDTATIDLNKRYPDFLKRRIDAAGLPFFVSNASISGNRVLQDGQIPSYGPAAITRLDLDVLKQAGVGTVIWLEGINDIGQTTGLTAAQLEQGYIDVIGRMHAAGFKVLQGTLTPTGDDVNPTYGSQAQPLRNEINTWIRTKSPADGVIDFDMAVRDPANPNNMVPAYNGGDGLHFSAAGYQRLAEAVDLSLLRAAP